MATKRVFKYGISFDGMVDMPKGARILCVQTQQHGTEERPCIWAVVDPDAPPVRRAMFIVGTGLPLDPRAGEYVGTFQMADGRLVFHLFDQEESP